MSLVVVVALALSPVDAQAAPPVVVFTENFENAVGPTQTIALTSYVGAAPISATYSADPYWLSATDCNGYVVPSAAPAAIAGCTKSTELQAMAQALGIVGGTAQNHAVAAHTDRSSVHPGADKVEFRTLPATPIPMPATNRYLAFSVDVASSNCQSNHALLKFSLLDGANEVPAFSIPIDACANPDPQNRARGRFFSDLGILNGSLSIGVIMRNGQANANGNDHAFDNITILDATPALSKSFSPSRLPVGGSSTLTFTIANTDERAAKPGWSLTDDLPAGLTIAGPAATTCASGVVVAPIGGTSVEVRGDLKVGQATCTVTVTVTSSAAATYDNGPRNIRSVGLDSPASSFVTFTATPSTTRPGTTTTVQPRPTMPGTGSPTMALTAIASLVIAIGTWVLAAARPSFRPARRPRGQSSPTAEARPTGTSWQRSRPRP